MNIVPKHYQIYYLMVDNQISETIIHEKDEDQSINIIPPESLINEDKINSATVPTIVDDKINASFQKTEITWKAYFWIAPDHTSFSSSLKPGHIPLPGSFSAFRESPPDYPGGRHPWSQPLPQQIPGNLYVRQQIYRNSS